MSRFSRLCGLLVLVCVSRLAATTATPQPAPPQPEPRQSATPLPVDAIVSMKSLARPTMPSLAVSPDGQLVAYAVIQPEAVEPQDVAQTNLTRTGMLHEVSGAVLQVTDVATGQTRAITAEGRSAYAPVWSPDGARLAFYYDGAGQAAVWIWTRATGRLQQVSSLRARGLDTYSLYWTPDGRHLLARVQPSDADADKGTDTSAKTTTSAAGRADTTPRVDVYEFDPAVPAKPAAALAGSRSRAWLLCDLAFIDVESGRVQRLASRVTPRTIWLSPDGRRVAWTTPRGQDDGDVYKPLVDLIVAERDTGAIRTVASEIRLPAYGNVSWSPDSRTLAFVASESVQRTSGRVADGQCYLVPADGSAPARRATDAPHPNFGHAFRAPVWSRDGTRIFALADHVVWSIDLAARRADRLATVPDRTIVHLLTPREGGRPWSPAGAPASIAVWTRHPALRDEGLYRLELETGRAVRIWEGPKSIVSNTILECDAVDGPASVVCLAEDFQHAPDLWLVTGPRDTMRQLSTINPPLQRMNVGSTRLVDWHNVHGERIQGVLALPPASMGREPYPLLVTSYPRRRFSDALNAFDSNVGVPVQLLTSRGYAVLCADTPIRSTDFAGDIAAAVLPGVTRLIDQGTADPARVGVFGYSGGGYDVMVLITRSSIFKAAVNLAGFADLTAFYGSFREPSQHYAVGWAEMFLGGTPWTVPQRYVDSSPFYALDRVRTPLLIAHGGADTGVEPHLANQIFIGLKRLGRPVTYVRYRDEGHGLSRPAQRDFIQRAIAWFDRHLKSAAETTPVPTGQARRSSSPRD